MKRRLVRYRDEESSSGKIATVVVAALAGLAVGVIVAQRMGGISGIRARLAAARGGDEQEQEYDAYGSNYGAEVADLDDEMEAEGADTELEDRVLEAFINDPILAERAVDIGSIGEGIVELAGWVDTEDEATHAMTLARGVPGVETVVNRMMIGDRERQMQQASSSRSGNAEGHWESHIVGTGRRRQGVSTELDRHADPRVELEERWTRTAEEMRNAAEDVDDISAERRTRGKKAPAGDRTGGAPVAPTGVPKGDHVANPREADRQAARTDAARDTRTISGAKVHDGDRP